MPNYIITSDGCFYSEDELYHYGVMGMKWGVRKAARLESRNLKLTRKALKYDAKSAKYRKKSEKQHAKKDLEAANRAATRGAAYMKKAANIRRKALKKDDYTQLRAEKKASKLEYKAAMKYSIKSDKVAIKAAKVRKKIASNNAYSAMMNKRLESLDPDKLNKIKTQCLNTSRKNLRLK